MSGATTAATKDGGTDGGRDDGRRARFGRLLAEALKARGMKQEQLAGALGTTQSSVSGWINGKYEPGAETVFRIERSLALEPGHLSRPLGYLPVEAVSAPAGVEGAILQSTTLREDEKAALLAVYQVLVGPTTTGPREARSRTQPARARASSPRRRSAAGTSR